MTRVQRENVVLYVEDADVQHYINCGYNVTSATGEVIHAAIPNDIGTLQKYYVETQAKISEMEATIANLTAQLSEHKTTRKRTTKATEE